MISVIIPVANLKPYLNKIRQSLARVSTPIEVIIVVSKDLEEKLFKKHPLEKIIVSEFNGRGFACAQGMRSAKGEIVIFLHADTILPDNWNKLILNAFANKNVVGGAFSLAFDTKHKYLKMLVYISDIFFKFTRELWGDRAIFIRSGLLKDNAALMEVPIMEDVRLSKFMRKKGKLVMLKENVTTSSDTFLKYGLFHHTFRIVKCRLWYALGGNIDRIYNYYYSKGHDPISIADEKSGKHNLLD